MNFAVVDTETTGINPARHDRVIEVAVVRLDADLEVEQEYTTLLNPDRDVGPTWLHGIRAGDLVEAPTFDDIAADLVDLLRGAVVVGHNVAFDLRFIEAEFARAGHPIGRPPYFDTMQAAARVGATSRCLEDVCDLFGVVLADAHSALGDAQATTGLFCRCVEHFGTDGMARLIRGPLGADDPPLRWPKLEARREPLTRRSVAVQQRDRASYLAQLVRDLPVSASDPGDWQGYFGVLDRALEDRRITDDEAAALHDAARESGMTGSDLREANRAYLGSLVSLALSDNYLSRSERRDLEEVAELLDLSRELPQLLAEPAFLPDDPVIERESLVGRSVCFTGALNAVIDGQRVTRGSATMIAQEHGLIIRKSVTKDLDVLVMSDPDSRSSKAKKARKYGVRIVAESVFWNLLGVSTDG